MISRSFAVCTLLLGLAFSAASHAVEIRVRNDTGEDLRNVVVGYRIFGNVGKGKTTQYQTWEKVTEIANVSARTASGVLGFRPKKPWLLQNLGEGRFTYVLTLSNGGLAMHAEKDAD